MSPLTQAKALTVGAIAEPSVEDDTRFLLRFLGHVNCQVQVFNPFSHLHFRAIVMQIKRKQQMRNMWWTTYILAASFSVLQLELTALLLPGSHYNGSLS